MVLKASKKRGGSGKAAAPALAKAAARKPTQSAPAARWSAAFASLPRTIRSRMLARTSRPGGGGGANGAGVGAGGDAANGGAAWAIGQWLGGAAASAFAAVQATILPGHQHQSAGANGDAGANGGRPLYIDREGSAHLGVNAGDDAPLMREARELQAAARRAALSSPERRRPDEKATRRAAAAAMQRAPRRERPPAGKRGAPLRAARQQFQPAERGLN